MTILTEEKDAMKTCEQILLERVEYHVDRATALCDIGVHDFHNAKFHVEEALKIYRGYLGLTGIDLQKPVRERQDPKAYESHESVVNTMTSHIADLDSAARAAERINTRREAFRRRILESIPKDKKNA